MDRKKRLTAVIGIVMTAALLLFAGARTPSARAAGTGASIPQVFGGAVLTAGGSPAAGAQVKLYLRPDKPGPATVIGATATSASGTWSFRAPAYGSLPKAAQAAAAANMGYLNVEVIATSNSSAAVAVETAWVGTLANTAETGSVKPTAMRMLLDPSTASAPIPPDCCRGKDGCAASQTGVLGHSHSYTTVGEYHAYWNASGGLSYTKGASSSIGAYTSVGNGPFTFVGWDTFSTSNSLTMGFPSNGPYDSHQMVLSLKYVKTAWVLQNADSGQTCKRWDQVDEDGIYNPGHGWLVFKKGANVISHDGQANYQWEKKHHPGYVNGVTARGFFSITKGSALTYGASAQAFGIKIEGTTSHSEEVAQTYTAGSSGSRRHWVWGDDGPWTSNPEVVYSY